MEKFVNSQQSNYSGVIDSTKAVGLLHKKLENRLHYRYFPISFAKFFRTTVLLNTLARLLSRFIGNFKPYTFTRYSPVFLIYTPWKHQKTFRFNSFITIIIIVIVINSV